LRAVEDPPSSRRKEVITIHAHPHPLELASQLLEDRVGRRIGKEVAKYVLAAVLKISRLLRLAGAIVLRPFDRVDEHGVGFADLLKALGGIGIVRVAVGMPVEREPPISLANLGFRGCRRDAKRRVIVLFECAYSG